MILFLNFKGLVSYVFLKDHFVFSVPEKTADISWHHLSFPHGMTSEKQVQKFHTDDTSLPSLDLGSTSDWFEQISHVAWLIKSTTYVWAFF